MQEKPFIYLTMVILVRDKCEVVVFVSTVIARTSPDQWEICLKLLVNSILYWWSSLYVCIWAIVVMAVYGVNVGTQLTPLWSAFIAASFIFGNSAKDAFESIIFVFVTHPFDTGDRIFIGSENWVVNNVGLSVSTFWNGMDRSFMSRILY